MRCASTLIALALLVGGPGAASAGSDDDRIEALERRVRELEAKVAETSSDEVEPEPEPPTTTDESWLADWARHVRLGGSGSMGYFDGEDRSLWDPASFEVWDTRLFIDAELGDDVQVADHTLVRNVGLSFELNLVRLGKLQDDLDQLVGNMYAELQGLGGSRWANARVGRFQLPVGENYLRFSEGYRDNPFITNTVGGPWWWDEGVRLDGSDERSRFGYVASVTSGETPFNDDANDDVMGTLKLWWNPAAWVHLSASGAVSGEVGSSSDPASGALWLGETWATAFGSMSPVANWVDGIEVADGPNRIDRTWFAGADAVFECDSVRLWLAYGYFGIESDGLGALYDRALQYWIAEIVLHGDLVHPVIAPLWLGLRANGIGTYDDDEGYLLDIRFTSKLGYNMESLQAYEVVLGWQLTRFASIRAQYSFIDVDVVNGVADEIRRNARRQNKFGVDVSLWF